jgi:hypothetical protein
MSNHDNSFKTCQCSAMTVFKDISWPGNSFSVLDLSHYVCISYPAFNEIQADPVWVPERRQKNVLTRNGGLSISQCTVRCGIWARDSSSPAGEETAMIPDSSSGPYVHMLYTIIPQHHCSHTKNSKMQFTDKKVHVEAITSI